MADKLDINKPIARDLEGAKKKARKDYEDAQRQVEKDATDQKWFGKKGFGSVSDESATENKAHRDRAFHESQRWEQDGQEFPKKYASGGKVRGVGVAQRGYGKGKIC